MQYYQFFFLKTSFFHFFAWRWSTVVHFWSTLGHFLSYGTQPILFRIENAVNSVRTSQITITLELKLYTKLPNKLQNNCYILLIYLYILEPGHAFEKHGGFYQFFEFFHSETCYSLTKGGGIKCDPELFDINHCHFLHYDCPPP